MVVERKASPRASSAGAVTTGAPGTGRPEGDHGGFYAEEQRFWRERCPYPAEATASDRREKEASADAAPRKTPLLASSSPGTQRAAGRAANYDYISAEAAYRSSPGHRAADDPYSNGKNDGFVRGGRIGRTPSRQKRANSDTEGGDGLGDADDPTPPKPRLPRRQVVGDGGDVHAAESKTRPNAERRRSRSRSRSRSLRDAEAVLHRVLESVEGGLTTAEVICDGVVPGHLRCC